MGQSDCWECMTGDLGQSDIIWTGSMVFPVPFSNTTLGHFICHCLTDPGSSCCTCWEESLPNPLYFPSFLVLCLEIIVLAPIQINSNQNDKWKWSYRWSSGQSFSYNSLLILREALGIVQNCLFDTALSGQSTDLSELINVGSSQWYPAFN